MAGFFSGTGSQRTMGNANRALYNNAIGSVQVQLRARLTAYYGITSGQVGLSYTLAGRYYPYTY
jgi:hypothetical protein